MGALQLRAVLLSDVDLPFHHARHVTLERVCTCVSDIRTGRRWTL